ncbi:hypothetical protein CEUSTIGMA_g1161.t1 [Chlamydomonas eustigma]|uniref:EH domain-containing protein n=1 Tax=Chlamydomonas eustigma TaxID=1157962 RepID=A0A250WSA1_9CHLO|nr:hypothetical protein CEUSTIGMA_g1161.t1 [Chlamydomonas eustigma]|eukprot:GAX73708.1 hypothetical protein CEUSTIGMA_g1161.t1 [Chlamydomonas eustigma]
MSAATKLDPNLVTQLFKLADEDRDGAIAGVEAVKFFSRSGLSQECMGQIWELASNGATKLTNTQFGSALRLVALAQVSGGRVPLDQARTTLAGLGPVLPAPQLTGLEQYGILAPGAYPQQPAGSTTAHYGYTPQITGAYTPQQTGAFAAPTTYTPQQTGGYAPQMTGGYVSQPTGGYVTQPTGGYTSPPPAYAPQSTGGTPSHTPIPPVGSYSQMTVPVSGLQYSPPNSVELQKYQGMFIQLDTDRDGIVQGGDCFTAFLQWGLDQAVLASIWDMVSGGAGHLNSQQFCQALNLMEIARRSGGKLPPPPAATAAASTAPVLVSKAGGIAAAAPLSALDFSAPLVTSGIGIAPPALAPPKAAWSLASQFAERPSTQSAEGPPVLPAFPQRFDFEEPEAPVVPPAPSKVPVVTPGTASVFLDSERAKVTQETKDAAAKETLLRAAQEEAARAKQRIAAFNDALQELTVFKSRTNVALLEAQDQASRLKDEAKDTERRYNAAFHAAQSANEESRRAVDAVTALLQVRNETEDKLRKLQQDIAEAEAMGPAQVVAVQNELAVLQQQVEHAESVRAGKMQQADMLLAQKGALEVRYNEVQQGIKAAEAELEGAGVEVARLQDAVEQLRRAQPDGGGQRAQGLLVRAARAYRSLLATVLRCGLELPFEADLLNNGGLLVEGRNDATGMLLAWVDDVVAGAADWAVDMDDDLRGYVVVNAMDTKLPSTPQRVVARSVSKAPGAADVMAAAAAAPPGNLNPSASFAMTFDDEEAPAFEALEPMSSQSKPFEAPSAVAAAASVATPTAGFGEDVFGEPAFGAATAPSPLTPSFIETTAHAVQSALPLAASEESGTAVLLSEPDAFGNPTWAALPAAGSTDAPVPPSLENSVPAAPPSVHGLSTGEPRGAETTLTSSVPVPAASPVLAFPGYATPHLEASPALNQPEVNTAVSNSPPHSDVPPQPLTAPSTPAAVLTPHYASAPAAAATAAAHFGTGGYALPLGSSFPAGLAASPPTSVHTSQSPPHTAVHSPPFAVPAGSTAVTTFHSDPPAASGQALEGFGEDSFFTSQSSPAPAPPAPVVPAPAPPAATLNTFPAAAAPPALAPGPAPASSAAAAAQAAPLPHPQAVAPSLPYPASVPVSTSSAPAAAAPPLPPSSTGFAMTFDDDAFA